MGVKNTWIDEGYRYFWEEGERVAVHRRVMELSLGRKLDPAEIVHHKNHNKLDNRVENLEVLTANEHNQYHQKRRQNGAFYSCLYCHSVFYRKRSKILKGWTKYCRRSCKDLALKGVERLRNDMGRFI